MLRLPPHGEGRHVQQRKKLWALAAILLPFVHLADADFHQPQSVDQHRPHTLASPSIVHSHAVHRDRSRDQQSSPLEGDRANRNLAATALPQYHSDLIDADAGQDADETPRSLLKTPEVQRRKSTYPDAVQPGSDLDTYHKKVSRDASAISATAPDLSVVAPPSRRLEDWEVEDFVLLATIDGDLYAADRKTGKERWHIYLDQPMVETKHHRANKSAIDDDFTPFDQTIWAVEPNRDGQIYMWAPGADKGLVYTGLSMKKLVDDFGPYKNDALSLIYTGDKKTTLLTLDAATGRAIQWHGPTASAAEDNICARPQEVVAGGNAEECSSATITLGRTEYTVGISSTRGFPIATLKFSEWTPNVFDQDLLRQYSSTRDDVYITSQHDGQAFAFDYFHDSGRTSRGRSMSFSQQLPSPIARAFDIMRPLRSTYDGEDSDATLIALPQPPPPSGAEQEEPGRDHKIYLNQTDGNWFAMSGRAYPLITHAPPALINQVPSFSLEQQPFTTAELERALVGQHTLEATWSRAGHRSFPTLPGSANSALDMGQADLPDSPTLAIDAPPDPSSTVINMVKNLPQDAVNYTVDLITNPVIFVILSFLAIVYRKNLIRSMKNFGPNAVKAVKVGLKQQGFDIDIDTDDDLSEEAPEVHESDAGEVVTNRATMPVENVDSARSEVQDEASQAAEIGQQATATSTEELNEPEVKKKKAHRGRRGGKAHKKKKNSPGDLSLSVDDHASTSVDDAVDMAKNIGERGTNGIEPDIRTIPGHVDEVSNPTFLIDGSLEVNEDQQLGMGSNGTVVYAGQWQGRPVAVKRMLRDFYDIASQETRLLREVDRHQNVIQYFAQLERGNFIYIALELCEASLADVMEKPSQFRLLADAGAKDPLAVLRQITMGLDHLHSLQIVHRDLKPQNILITMDRNKSKPRILVSDFGLCKKLEGGQSSFGATTAHAAGTSGWRAPELLHDDDGPANTSPALAESSTHSGSPGSQALEMPQRRVTRSIDIFSLGVVFFYVLTQGSHPFDCGDKYMRESNIRKAVYSLARLDILGDYKYEAKDLVGKMISSDPKRRPKTLQILAHPFFWDAKTRLSFLCDVSDAFEKEPRDPPSWELQQLESEALDVTKGDFLAHLHKEFIESLGKQRKYTGSRLLDLLRALRNKRNHYHDMSDTLQKKVGSLPDGYLFYWTSRFPRLLLYCWEVVRMLGWHEQLDQFKLYYQPPEST
ncbi:unnamed protein product [Discula destructiva]